MRNATDINICNNEVIIHILDPKHAHNGTVISAHPISLLGRPDLLSFFCGHIQNGLRDTGSKAAKFRYIGEALPSGYSAGLLDGSLQLLPASQRLAELLNTVMDNNHNISSGDLVVCLFEAGNFPGHRFVALLKIDPSNAFSQETLFDDQGLPYIDLQLRPNALPTIKEKLQKCAFIQSLNPRNEDFDMLLLDRQSSADQGKQVAKFFIHDFLDAIYSFDATQRTKRLYEGLVSAHTRIKDTLSDEQNEDLDNRIRDAVTAQSINLDLWLEQLPLSDDHKQLIDEILLSYMPDREFEIDRAEGERVSKKRRFRAEYQFRLSLTAEGYKRVVKEDRWHDEDGIRPRFHRLVIETESWDEIPNPR